MVDEGACILTVPAHFYTHIQVHVRNVTNSEIVRHRQNIDTMRERPLSAYILLEGSLLLESDGRSKWEGQVGGASRRVL